LIANLSSKCKGNLQYFIELGEFIFVSAFEQISTNFNEPLKELFQRISTIDNIQQKNLNHWYQNSSNSGCSPHVNDFSPGKGK